MIWLLKYWRVAAAGLAVLAALGAVWYYGNSRYNAGEAAAEARMAKLVAEASANTETAERNARKITEDQAHEIETLRAARAAEADRARAVIQPVRLCKPARREREVPGVAGAAGSVDGAEAGEELPLRAGPDIGAALVVFAASCQLEFDDAARWRAWYAEQARAQQPR